MSQENQNSTLRIKLKKSAIGRVAGQKATVAALGLRKIGETVERPDTATTRGMIFKVKHLVEVVD